ncbi:hypothetical protein BUL40_06530 [Croceivirga radicis]|uniref:Uncharacterized protein n=1 Tax=Croceivirga radicis TaxID=1929488 RepID=A0A1V6LTI4_9FLAO|nr:hypothetical protein [Croceivirga radicis]OQD43482.1 hypothetical protein BUL40_06530 [Croceivirga radicis]
MKKDSNKSHKLPKGYFENFNQRLMDRIAAEDATTASTLIPKTDGFTVPEGYFEAVQPKVSKAVATNKKTKVIPLLGLKNWMAIAASIAIAIVTYLGINRTNTNSIALDSLSNAEILAYLNNQTDVTTYDLAELVNPDNINTNLFSETQLEEELILDYFDENLDDLDTIDFEYEDYE